ncbi:MAG TPA: DoxX family protein [Anaerolineales bacterium]|nr:DoxX family protein [Anaerolineales bacterium]
MNIALWSVQGLLAAMFGLAGFTHGFQMEKARAQLAWAKDASDALLRFVGTAENLGALGLILPMVTGILPWLTPWAAIGLAIIQILALFTVHLPRKEYIAIPINGALMALGTFLITNSNHKE